MRKWVYQDDQFYNQGIELIQKLHISKIKDKLLKQNSKKQGLKQFPV